MILLGVTWSIFELGDNIEEGMYVDTKEDAGMYAQQDRDGNTVRVRR